MTPADGGSLVRDRSQSRRRTGGAPPPAPSAPIPRRRPEYRPPPARTPRDDGDRVVVVGAGVGGLAAAIRLAAQGRRVTVVEAARTPGGKLARHREGGFTWDVGPSLVTMPWVLDDLFAATGADRADYVDLVPIDPICRYRWPGGATLDATSDLAAMSVRLDALAPGASSRFARLLGVGAGMWQLGRPAFLDGPLMSPLDLARSSGDPRDLRTIRPWGSLSGLARETFGDLPGEAAAGLVQMIERYATYSGSDPRRVPQTLGLTPYVEYAFGGWYVRGGLYAIIEALVCRLGELGGELVLGTPVAGIERRGGRAVGVRLAGGERLGAADVVVNADAARLYADLLPSRRQRLRARVADRSLAGFVLLLGVDGTTPELAHHTLSFGPPARYHDEFDAIFGAGRPVGDPAIYVTVSAKTDPTQAPAGAENWFVLVNAPPHTAGARRGRGGTDWDVEGPRYAEHVLDVLAARGLDVRPRLRTISLRTPADLERTTRTPGGSIYGQSSNGPLAAFLRPANRSPVADGLWLVGGSAHPGGGLPIVMLSAKITADLIAATRTNAGRET